MLKYIPTVQCCTVTTTQHILSTDQNRTEQCSAVQCSAVHSSAVSSKPSHFCLLIVSTRNFYSAVKSTNTQNQNFLQIVIHTSEDEMVDRMSQRREKCGASVNIARGWCPRQWTSHGNNTNTTNNPSTCQTPRHPARIFKCKSGKKGAGEIERIKVPPDKEAQTRPWCRPSRKINYRSTLIVEVTAAQPGQ